MHWWVIWNWKGVSHWVVWQCRSWDEKRESVSSSGGSNLCNHMPRDAGAGGILRVAKASPGHHPVLRHISFLRGQRSWPRLSFSFCVWLWGGGRYGTASTIFRLSQDPLQGLLGLFCMLRPQALVAAALVCDHWGEMWCSPEKWETAASLCKNNQALFSHGSVIHQQSYCFSKTSCPWKSRSLQDWDLSNFFQLWV